MQPAGPAMALMIDNAMPPHEVTLCTSDLQIATPDASDPLLDGAVSKALQLLRVDAVFAWARPPARCR